MDKPLRVEVLEPPKFSRTGKIVDRTECWKKGYWYGAFNLWIVSNKSEPSIIYQVRSPNIGWAPGKLDVALAGHYENGESIEQAIEHEGPEELRIEYKFKDLVNVGRKLNVGLGTDGTFRNSVNDLFLTKDERPFDDFKPQEDEVYAVCSLPVSKLLKVHADSKYEFKTQAKKFDGTTYELIVNQDMFPYNWDNYHFKMALLIKRFFDGDKTLIY